MIEEYKKEKSTNLTINVQADEINEIREVTLEKNSTRIFKDGKIFSANYLGKVENDDLKKNALENTYGSLEFDYSLNDSVVNQSSFGKKLRDLDVVDLTKDLLSHFQKNLPDFIYSGKVDYNEVDTNLVVSSGIDIKQTESSVEGFLIMKRKGSPNIMDSALGFSIGDGNIDLSNFDNFIDLHKKFDNVVDVKSGRSPVIFVSEKDFLQKFSQSLSPESYHQGSAYYSDKLGEKLFNEKVNLVDVRVDESDGLFNIYDSEGEKLSPELPLIENGVFKNIFYDKNMAKKYKATSTGNGKREFNSSVFPRAYHLDFVAGDKTYKELVASFEKVIVIIMAGGGDTTTNGDYSSPVQVGFVVENGNVVGRTPEITISGNIDQMMGEDFIAISSDKFYPTRSHSFMCHMNIIK
ncbi:MAG: hypothetical protein BM556_15175 [Bacteriovorax sp. MedPE-SWde]|nr:MAG: hypothetical protein BM556_15175 [Bacteriovorax sp. MedPE-SWde]